MKIPVILRSRWSDRLSLGRVLTLLTFSIMVMYWMSPFTGEALTPPESLNSVLNSLLLYEVFKKGRDVYVDSCGKDKGSDCKEE